MFAQNFLEKKFMRDDSPAVTPPTASHLPVVAPVVVINFIPFSTPPPRAILSV